MPRTNSSKRFVPPRSGMPGTRFSKRPLPQDGEMNVDKLFRRSLRDMTPCTEWAVFRSKAWQTSQRSQGPQPEARMQGSPDPMDTRPPGPSSYSPDPSSCSPDPSSYSAGPSYSPGFDSPGFDSPVPDSPEPATPTTSTVHSYQPLNNNGRLWVHRSVRTDTSGVAETIGYKKKESTHEELVHPLHVHHTALTAHFSQVWTRLSNREKAAYKSKLEFCVAKTQEAMRP